MPPLRLHWNGESLAQYEILRIQVVRTVVPYPYVLFFLRVVQVSHFLSRILSNPLPCDSYHMQYFHGMSHLALCLCSSSIYAYLQASLHPPHVHSRLRRPSAILNASGLVNLSGPTYLKAAATVALVGCPYKALETPMPRYTIRSFPIRY